jgi:hypothetical protein
VSAKKILVTRCSACPFFEDSPLKNLGGIFTQALLADAQYGICDLLPSGEVIRSVDLKIGLPPGPERDAEEPKYAKAKSRRVVEDKRTIPADCPLISGAVTIVYGGGN